MLNAKALTKARVLRKRMTEPEKVLWRELRTKKLGFKFRRQEAFVFEDYHFIADFCCPDKKLIIEIDGGIHNDPEMKEYDKFRTESFEIAGYKVIRFKNKEILNNLEKVLIKIKKVLSSGLSPD